MTSADLVPLNIPQCPHALQIYVHGAQDKHVSRQLRQEGIWEPYETSLLLALLAAGETFVDVGANIGYFSLLAAAIVGEQGQVVAFEPDPDNMRLLLASAQCNQLHGQIHAVEAGLTMEAGQGRLFLSEDNFGDHQIYQADNNRSSLDITLYNGSRYLAEHIERLDVLKVDTQGSEFEVMAGLMPLLQSLPRSPAIIIELTPLSLRQAGSSGRLLIELLASLDVVFWIIDHIEHQLAASSAEELARWCDNVDACEGDEGFMNILVGPVGLDQRVANGR